MKGHFCLWRGILKGRGFGSPPSLPPKLWLGLEACWVADQLADRYMILASNRPPNLSWGGEDSRRSATPSLHPHGYGPGEVSP